MVGQNIEDLRRTVAGMRPGAVTSAALEWQAGADSLSRVRRAIRESREGIERGFGAGTKVAVEALALLARMDDVIEQRHVPMAKVARELTKVSEEMTDAKTVNGEMPESSPGAAPRPDPAIGAGETAEEVTALKQYLARSNAHNREVAAYGDADERARKKVRDVNEQYQRAIDAMAELHGERDPERRKESETPVNGPGYSNRGPRGTQNPTQTFQLGHDDQDDNGWTGDPDGNVEPPDGGTGGNDSLDPTDPGVDIDPHHPGVDPGTDPGWGGPLGGGAGAGAGIGAGVLGGLGIRGLLNGATPTVTVPGQQVTRPIGATAARGGSSVLGGRGNSAAAPGQAVGRGGAAGRGTGGRGTGGRGVPGSAAGRGTGGRGVPGSAAGRGTGGRGAGGRGAVGAAGGRGRGKNDPEGRDKERYDVEEDWTEDEGQYPGIIG